MTWWNRVVCILCVFVLMYCPRGQKWARQPCVHGERHPGHPQGEGMCVPQELERGNLALLLEDQAVDEQVPGLHEGSCCHECGQSSGACTINNVSSGVVIHMY